MERNTKDFNRDTKDIYYTKGITLIALVITKLVPTA